MKPFDYTEFEMDTDFGTHMVYMRNSVLRKLWDLRNDLVGNGPSDFNQKALADLEKHFPNLEQEVKAHLKKEVRS